jgi:methionyl aminopeptidase
VFPGNICISLNDEVVHGIGSQRRIQYGDIVKLDIGVIQDGWVGDTATTVPVGMIEERIEQLLRTTETALERGIKVAVEGMRLGDICAEIEDEAVRNRFSVVREFVGHGVGRKLHEEPQIPNYGKRGSGPKLKAGMTLAIEPMINMGAAEVRLLEDGWTVRTADRMPSAHFEHTVLITKEEPEILTWRAKTQLR